MSYASLNGFNLSMSDNSKYYGAVSKLEIFAVQNRQSFDRVRDNVQGPPALD